MNSTLSKHQLTLIKQSTYQNNPQPNQETQMITAHTTPSPEIENLQNSPLWLMTVPAFMQTRMARKGEIYFLLMLSLIKGKMATRIYLLPSVEGFIVTASMNISTPTANCSPSSRFCLCTCIVLFNFDLEAFRLF